MRTHRSITRLLVTKVINLPHGLRVEVQQTQRAYVEEFAALLRAASPALTTPQSQVVVLAAFAVVKDVLRRPDHAVSAPWAPLLAGPCSTRVACLPKK